MTSPDLHPDFTGVWKLDTARSVLKGPAPMQTLMRIEHQGERLLQHVLVIRANGSKVRQSFALENGAETTVSIAGMEARIRADWLGDVLVVETRMKLPDRITCLRDHWSLSSDRQTLTMAHPDDDLAGQVSILTKCPDREFDGA